MNQEIGVTFNGLKRQCETGAILIDFNTFRDRVTLAMCREEAERLRDALIERYRKGADGMSEERYDEVFDVWSSSTAVWVKVAKRSGSYCTHRLEAEDAVKIGECGKGAVLTMAQSGVVSLFNIRRARQGPYVMFSARIGGNDGRVFRISVDDALAIAWCVQNDTPQPTDPVLACQDWDGTVPRLFKYCPECGERLR